ncbi:MAG: lysophospholipid acyltransferase family protein [Pseudomonadota bacterium]
MRGNATLRGVLARVASAYIRLVLATTRWEVIGEEIADHVRAELDRVVLVCWHGRLALLPALDPGELAIEAMISRHADGELIFEIVERFGVRGIRGSSEDRKRPGADRGGSAAYRAALRAFGRHPRVIVAISPDGPRGPRQRCKAGVAALSTRTEVPVLPFAYATRRAVTLGSWDRFVLPLPFGRGVLGFGPLLAPGGPAAVEAHRAAIEAGLNAITDACDLAAGRRPAEPAP